MTVGHGGFLRAVPSGAGAGAGAVLRGIAWRRDEGIGRCGSGRACRRGLPRAVPLARGGGSACGGVAGAQEPDCTSEAAAPSLSTGSAGLW